MRKFLLLSLLVSVVALSGCETLNLDKPNCYERVAISKIALTEAYSTAASLSNADTITVNTAEKTLVTLDQADTLVDRASAYCVLDEVVAYDHLKFAGDLIDQATDLMKEKN